MARAATTSVEAVLRAYAERGVFRSLDVQAAAGGATQFTLHWLSDVPTQLVYEGRARLLKLKHLLPNVPARSALHADLQRFIDERMDARTPAHRRLDRAALDVSWVIERRKATLVVKVRKGDAATAVRRIVNLTHELFVFLQDSWAEYMWASFGTSTE